MSIISKIKSLFIKPIEQEDISENFKEYEDRHLMWLYEKTKEQAKEVAIYKPGIYEAHHQQLKQDMYKIQFCFIPPTQNYKNVRSWIEYTNGHWQQWQDLRLKIFKLNRNKCIACHRDFSDKYLELHEHWSFDDIDNIQKLTRLMCLCEDCHGIAHINRFEGNVDKIFDLCKKYQSYNNLPESDFWADFEQQKDLREVRKNKQYTLDLSLLNKFGFDVNKFDCHSSEFNHFINSTFKKDHE